MYSLGLDIGATWVTAAIVRDGAPAEDSVAVPCAAVADESGALRTGDAVAAQVLDRPDRVATALPRRLVDARPLVLGGTPRPVTTVLATLLGDVVAAVADREGGPPGRTVLAHPASWDPFGRELLAEIPVRAGLGELPSCSSADAIAAHLGAVPGDAPGVREGDVLVVVDLGGGTVDAAALRRVGGGRFAVAGEPGGLAELGGLELDDALLARVDELAGGVLAGLDPDDPRDAAVRARARHDVMRAREALTTATSRSLTLARAGDPVTVELTLDDLERALRAPVGAAVDAAAAVLRAAPVDEDEVVGVLLVGGASRIPMVARELAGALGVPAMPSAHPEWVVALGAAHVAAGGRAVTGADPDPTVRVGADPERTVRVVGAAAAPGAGDDSPTRRVPPRSPEQEHPGRHGASGPRRALPDAEPPRAPDAPGTPAWTRSRTTGVPRRLIVVIAALVALGLAGGTVWFASTSFLPSSPATVPAAPGAPAVVPAALAEPPRVVAPSGPSPRLAAPIPVGGRPEHAAISPNGRLLYVADPSAGAVTVVDTATRRVSGTIPIRQGPPRYVTFSPDGRRAVVTVFGEPGRSAVVLVDTVAGRVAGAVPFRTRPFGPAVSPDGRTLWVPDHDAGAVTVLDTANGAVLREVPLGASPHWVAFAPDGTRVYVTLEEDDTVVELDPATDREISRVGVGPAPYALAVHPSLPLAVEADHGADTVTVVETYENERLATVAVGATPTGVAWSADGRFAYAVSSGGRGERSDGSGTGDRVTVIDARTRAVTATLATPPGATSIAVHADGRTGYVTCAASGEVAVLDLAR